MNISSLYIHVPFCFKKCGYCVFHSLPLSNNSDLISRYFDRLENEIKINSHFTAKIDSIYIGGGTPSVLSTVQLERLFKLIFRNFYISDNTEISIECNPESISTDKIKLISNYANRISLGVQSFNQSHRNILGRQGNNKTIFHAIESAFDNNIKNISIDLIYGIPTQSLNNWKDELNNALQLPIKHISTYALSFEEGSELYSNYSPEFQNFDDIVTDMYSLTADLLPTCNIHKYEISNYSKPGFECKHNVDIWYGSKYLGIGPTASSFDGINRWTQPEINQWLNFNKPEIDILSRDKRILEIFMMGLRTIKGWNINHEKADIITFESPYKINIQKQKNPDHLRKLNNFNCSKTFSNSAQNTFDKPLYLTINAWNNIIEKLKSVFADNLIRTIQISKNRTNIAATEKGLLFWNEIAMELL